MNATQISTNIAKRIPWVDYARGISIVFVVYHHALSGISRTGLDFSTLFKTADEIILKFRMPLFFILSGIFISHTIEKYQGKAFIRLKSKMLLYPYFVWGIIQITLQLLLSKYTNSQRSIIDYTYLITNPRAIDQLWYLLALFNCSLLFFFLKYILKLNKLTISVLAIIMFAFTRQIELSLFRDITSFFLFLVIGTLSRQFFIEEKYQRYFKSIPVLLISLPFFFAGQWYWLSHRNINLFLLLPLILLGCFVICSVSFILATRNRLSWITLIGKNSLHIYLMHVLVLAFTRTVVVKFFHINNVPLILLICCIAGVIVPIFAYKILSKTPAIVLFEPTIKPKNHKQSIE